MSQVQVPSKSASTSESSTGTSFKTIITDALEEYKKKTKTDLTSHPLAAKLKSCESTNDILAILRAQVETFDKSQSPDEKLTKWLDPTVNVLYAFSAVLGSGVGLVIATVNAVRIYSLTCVAGISPFECDICWDRCPLTSKHIFLTRRVGVLDNTSPRPLRMSALAKTLS